MKRQSGAKVEIKKVLEFLDNWNEKHDVPPLHSADWDERAVEIAAAYLQLKVKYDKLVGTITALKREKKT